jgi:Transglycosylase SLT domain
LSEAYPVGPVRSADVRGAIARAAERTGMDFDYLLAQARLESGLDPAARAGTSSAAGLYQFTNSTWLATLDRHGSAHGLAMPASRGEALALRYDPQASALMAAELAGDNRDALQARLGREPDAAELYLAHFLGAGGAGRFLSALSASPEASAAALMPEAARANRAIFYQNGAPRSVAGVMDLLRGKVERAMGMESPAASGEDSRGWALPGSHGVAWNGQPSPLPQTTALPVASHQIRPSIAEVLRTTFASNTTDRAMPAQVGNAYNRLRTFGL